MAQLTRKRSALNMFYDIGVIPNPISKTMFDKGLDDILTAVEIVVHSTLRRMKCFKFQLIVDAVFQVITFI